MVPTTAAALAIVLTGAPLQPDTSTPLPTTTSVQASLFQLVKNTLGGLDVVVVKEAATGAVKVPFGCEISW